MTTRSDRKPLVLAVDDEPANLQVLAGLLRSERYEVSVASNGREAVAVAQATQPDLILLDLIMPEMNGFEACRRLRELPKFRHTPIIFLTARTEIDSIVEGFEVGGSDYVFKPFNAPELLARMRTHYELSQTRQELAEANRSLEVANRELATLAEHQKLFFAIVAHDLKRPFSGIGMLSERVQSDTTEWTKEELIALLHAMTDSFAEANQLLGNLVDWSSVQMGQVEYLPESVAVLSLAQSVAKPFAATIAKKSLKVAWQIPSDLTVWADREMLRCILRNILGNAVGYANPNGRISLAAGTERSQFHFCVTNDGPPIPQETIEGIFDLGKRSTTQTDTPTKTGSGLGLVISKLLLDNAGGTIEVVSTEDDGTTVTIKLPLDPGIH